MNVRQTLRFVEGLLEVALEAATWTRDNPWGKDYMHVSREKLDHASHFLRKSIDRERRVA